MDLSDLGTDNDLISLPFGALMAPPKHFHPPSPSQGTHGAPKKIAFEPYILEMANTYTSIHGDIPRGVYYFSVNKPSIGMRIKACWSILRG